MKKLLGLFFGLMVLFLLSTVAFAQEAVSGDVTQYDKILDFLATSWTWVAVGFKWLGGACILGTVIDGIVPDEYDKGFMSKLYNIPILGLILKSLRRFSPFNISSTKQ